MRKLVTTEEVVVETKKRNIFGKLKVVKVVTTRTDRVEE